MPTGPGDERAGAAGGRGHLRTSHADREQVIALLKVAFVQGGSPKSNWMRGWVRRSARGRMRSWPSSPLTCPPG
jgi:hypothetical protein